MERQVRVVEILADFCGHISPGWFPFDCHVAIVAIDDQAGLYCDGDLIIGEEAYLQATARRYIEAMLGTKQR